MSGKLTVNKVDPRAAREQYIRNRNKPNFDISEQSQVAQETGWNDPSYYKDSSKVGVQTWYPDKQGLALPGTKYTGPGNSLNRGPGINESDDDAHIHDTEYHTARSHQDIQKADINLLSRAGDHIIEGISGEGTLGNTILSAVQAAGIGTKYGLEKATGPIYPSKFAGKPWHHQNIAIIQTITLICHKMN